MENGKRASVVQFVLGDESNGINDHEEPLSSSSSSSSPPSPVSNGLPISPPSALSGFSSLEKRQKLK